MSGEKKEMNVGVNFRVNLVVDGKNIPLNSYVRSVFFKIISALISTLKGIEDEWSEVKIELKREKP